MCVAATTIGICLWILNLNESTAYERQQCFCLFFVWKSFSFVQFPTKMSYKPSDEKYQLSCCQSSAVTTPEDSIAEDSIGENDSTGNNNTMFHTLEIDDIPIKKGLLFNDSAYGFPKRMAVDVEFQNIKYTVGKFSFRSRKFGKSIAVISSGQLAVFFLFLFVRDLLLIGRN